MNELIINLHMHTTYSDGSGTHAELGQAALKTGVDVLAGYRSQYFGARVDAYYQDGKKRVLLLACEEIHDQDRNPRKTICWFSERTRNWQLWPMTRRT